MWLRFRTEVCCCLGTLGDFVLRAPSHLRQGLLDPLLIDDEPLLIDDEDLEDAERRRLHVNAWADGVRLLITVHPLKAVKRTGE